MLWLMHLSVWEWRYPMSNEWSEADDVAIERLIRECVAAKKLGHGSNDGEFLRPEKAMYQIGG